MLASVTISPLVVMGCQLVTAHHPRFIVFLSEYVDVWEMPHATRRSANSDQRSEGEYPRISDGVQNISHKRHAKSS